MGLPKTTLEEPGNLTGGNKPSVADHLLETAHKESDGVLTDLESRSGGLSAAEAEARLQRYGQNEIAREKHPSALARLLGNVKNPLVILLVALGLLSYLTGDLRATEVMFVMVLLGVVLRFYQEMRADNASEKLKAMANITATVVRDGKDAEVALKFLVPGDMIRLSAGDMVPADARILSAKDLFLNEAAPTGNSLPVEKTPAHAPEEIRNPLDLPNICFLGSAVESGTATAVVVYTGEQTYFGSLAASIVGQRELTSFEKGG